MTNGIGSFARAGSRLGRMWWMPVVAGVVWVGIGFVVLRFDHATVDVIAVLFGAMLLAAAALELLRFVIGAGTVWQIVLGVLLIVGSIVAFADPGGTFVSLAFVAGLYFVIAGTASVIAGLGQVDRSGWWLQLLTGIAQIMLGLFASSSFASSAIVLVTYVSVSAVLRGVTEIAAGFALRAQSRCRAEPGQQADVRSSAVVIE